MKFRYLLSLIQMMRIPGFLKIFKDLQSSIRFQFFHAALESGLLEALKTQQSKNDLQKRLQVKRPELLDALLDVGISIGELSLKNEKYGLKGSVSKSLITEKGDAMGALIQAQVTYYNSAYKELADRMKGGALSDDLNEIGGLVAKVSKLQNPLIHDFIHYTVKGKEAVNLLEIGCGSGTFMKTAFEINNKVSGLGIDCDNEVVKQAQNNMEKWGLSNQFNIIKGDIRSFDLDGYGPFDLVTLYNIIYYFEPEERIDLIKKLKVCLASQGRIAVVITVQTENTDSAAASLNLVNTSLKGVTPLPRLTALEKLFEDSGFQNVTSAKIIPGGSLYSLIAT